MRFRCRRLRRSEVSRGGVRSAEVGTYFGTRFFGCCLLTRRRWARRRWAVIRSVSRSSDGLGLDLPEAPADGADTFVGLGGAIDAAARGWVAASALLGRRGRPLAWWCSLWQAWQRTIRSDASSATDALVGVDGPRGSWCAIEHASIPGLSRGRGAGASPFRGAQSIRAPALLEDASVAPFRSPRSWLALVRRSRRRSAARCSTWGSRAGRPSSGSWARRRVGWSMSLAYLSATSPAREP